LIKNYEMNEVGWWSQWSNLVWLSSKVYLLSTQFFDEPLFNRLGYTEKQDFGMYLQQAESVFRSKGVKSNVVILDSHSSLAGRLLTDGYTQADRMHVLECDHITHMFTPEGLHVTTDDSLEEWERVYLEVFYGSQDLFRPVTLALRRAMATGRVTLLHKESEGRVVSVLATYESERFLGVYCVGTLPSQRGHGHASQMIFEAARLAASKGKGLILQCFESDSVEGFYEKLGFRRVYTKRVFTKGTALPQKQPRHK